MKKALILLNMGGANNLNEVEVFLNNMFADPNILMIKNSFIRNMVGKFIVFKRKNIAKENYKLIGGKSPLPELTKKLVTKLQKKLPYLYVTYAMRYTPPFDYEVIKELKEKNIEEIHLIPLYPQYSTTTTKSSFDGIEIALKKLNYNPIVKKIDKFYEDRFYNEAIINRIKESLLNNSANEFDLIFSAHGLPQKIIDRGDTYQKEIEENIKILKEMLKEKNMNFKNIHLAYQSKVTPVKWLEPSLENKLNAIDNKNIVIYPISFIIDNSETDFELSIEYKEIAKNLNFKKFIVSKCLNDSDLFMKALIKIENKI